MIQIERLRMRLPKGFEHRATSIARMVGEVLAEKNMARQDQVIETLSVTPKRIPLNTPDREIANLIVQEIIVASGGKSS
jgi:hypothetical protein